MHPDAVASGHRGGKPRAANIRADRRRESDALEWIREKSQAWLLQASAGGKRP